MHAHAPPRFRLQLLGAPRLTENGADRPWPSRRALALLACLAVEGRVTRARLAELFWDGLDEPDARRNLRRELARLRDAGLEAVFDASGDILALGGEVASDLRAFEAADAEPETALAAWQGPLLDGFALADAPRFDDWLAEQRERVLRRWREAAGIAAAAREAAGDARAALEIHLRLLAADPLQELHHANAMRLHYLLGERTAALEVYERCRRTLREELGLEPLAATSALAERIRAAEQLAPLVARRAATLRTQLDAPLIGRDAPAERLRASNAPIVLLIGEPGVGKTRLAQESLLARSTVSLRCEAAAAGAALHPVAEALRAALDQPRLVERLVGVDPALRREAARLLPALDPAARFDGGEPAPTGQQHLFDALAALLDALAGRGGTLWVDDLHWGDAATVALLVQLAHRRARDPLAHLRVVAAARPQELGEHPALRDALLALQRAGLLERIELEPLAPDDTLAFVRALSGSEKGTRFAARLQKLTRGNPFFLLETLRFLFDSGELTIDERGQWVTRYDEATADYAELPVPPSLAATVLERIDRLGPASRRVLEAAALAGAGFALREVQPATALADWEALDGLERALGAELLVVFGSGYRFAHDLVREALAAQLGSERRRLIHHRLARTLVALRGRADLIANHLAQAGRGAEALPWHVTAAHDAARLYAWREALEQSRAALALGPGREQQLALVRARIGWWSTLHDLPGLASELDAFDALAGDDAMLVIEGLAARTAQGLKRHRYGDAVAHAQRAWALPEFAHAPAPLRHALLRDGAFALVENGHYDVAREIYERELANAAEHPPAFVGALHHGMANLLTSLSRDAEAREHLVKAEAFYAEAGEEERRLRAVNILAYTEYMTGDVAAAMRTMETLLADAERLKHISLLRSTTLNFMMYCLEAGDLARSEQLLARAQELLQGVDDPATQCRLQLRVAEVAALRGELGDALRAARLALAQIEANGGGIPDFWPWFVLSRLLWWIGDREGAARVYRGLLASPAYLPTAEPATRFFPAAWRLPDDAAQACALFETIGEDASGVLVQADAIAFFHALALHALARDEEALSLLEPSEASARPGFVIRVEDHLALRLRVRAALGRPSAEGAAQAERALASAAPLLQLRLHGALAAMDDARGARDAAAARRATAHALARRLSATLEGEPQLRARFDAQHGLTNVHKP